MLSYSELIRESIGIGQPLLIVLDSHLCICFFTFQSFDIELMCFDLLIAFFQNGVHLCAHLRDKNDSNLMHLPFAAVVSCLVTVVQVAELVVYQHLPEHGDPVDASVST